MCPICAPPRAHGLPCPPPSPRTLRCSTAADVYVYINGIARPIVGCNSATNQGGGAPFPARGVMSIAASGNGSHLFAAGIDDISYSSIIYRLDLTGVAAFSIVLAGSGGRITFSPALSPTEFMRIVLIGEASNGTLYIADNGNG